MNSKKLSDGETERFPFEGETKKTRTKLLFKSKLGMYTAENQIKDIDLIFVPKFQYNLLNMQSLWPGKTILSLGSLSQHLKLNSPQEDANQHINLIPSEALVFVEMKLPHKEFIDVLQQQNVNLICFLKWLQNDINISSLSLKIIMIILETF